MITMLLILAVLGGAFPAAAMDWPAPEEGLAVNFGANDKGSPALGAVFEHQGLVNAAAEGELLYRRREGETASRLPSPLGVWAAVDHRDGIISLYSRLGDLKVPAGAGEITRNTIIGGTGVSGWSEREGFYFSLFDRKERRWINPQMIVTSFPDTRPPLIQSVRLRNAKGLMIDPAQEKTISQGRYAVSVVVSDTRVKAEEKPLAPYRILCSVNGREAGALSFETFSARNGVLMVYRNGLIPAKQVYAPYPGFEVAELTFTRGQVILEVIAQDFAGNSRNAVYRIGVE